MIKKKTYLIYIPVFAAAVMAGLSFGSEFINPFDMASDLLNGGDSLMLEVLLYIRLPRVLAASAAGAALSVSGAVFQSVFRNPLADPFVTGVSGGASLGISAAVIFSLGPAAVMICSFAGSVAAIAVLYILSYARGFSGSVFILSGVAMSFIFSSSVMLLFVLADSQSVHKALIWMMGDLSSAGDSRLAVVIPLIVLVISILWFYHRHLDIISLGRVFSRSSGVSDYEMRLVLVLGSLLPALSVMLGGIIPFIGLMVPHAVSIISGRDSRRLIPASAFGGASFLVLCDAAGRSMVFPFEVPVGIITGFAGGIFFLLFVISKRGVE